MKLRNTQSAFLALILFAIGSYPQTVNISSIQARLFYENTGTFSENVLTDKGFDLWNTPFDWVYSTFVTVEVDGVPKYLEKHRQIELTAKYIPFDAHKRSIAVKQTEKIRNGSETGQGLRRVLD